MNTCNAIVSKDIFDQRVEAIKNHELIMFEALCKDYGAYDPVNKKHLEPSFYESMIDKLQRKVNTFLSEHQDLDKSILEEYTKTEMKKINACEYLHKELKNYKQKVETRIALIPKDSNQLLKDLTTLVEEIIKNIVKETNVRYSYILNKMLYSVIDESIEQKVVDKIYRIIRNKIVKKSLTIDENGINNEKKVLDIFKPIKQHMCKFITYYLILSDENIIEKGDSVTYYLKDFETAVNHGIYDWFFSNINESILEKIDSSDIADIVTDKLITNYNDNIKNSVNALFSKYLVEAFRYLNLSNYFDETTIKKYIKDAKKSVEAVEDRSVKAKILKNANTLINAYKSDEEAVHDYYAIMDEKAKQAHDESIEKAYERVENAKQRFEEINAKAEKAKAELVKNKDEHDADITIAQTEVDEAKAKLKRYCTEMSIKARKEEKAKAEAIDKAVKEAVKYFDENEAQEYEGFEDEADKIRAELAESAKKQAIIDFEDAVRMNAIKNKKKDEDNIYKVFKLQDEVYNAEIRLKHAKALSKIDETKNLIKRAERAKNAYENEVNVVKRAEAALKAKAETKASEESVDAEVEDIEIKELEIEVETEASNGVRKVIIEEIDDDDDETNAKPTLEGFVNTIPLNAEIEASDMLNRYNSYFKTSINAKALGRRISKFFDNERKTAKKIRYYVRK